MIKLDNLEQQIVLYTKGHFKKTNLVYDLKTIIGHYVAIDVQFLFMDSVYCWVSKTYFQLFSKDCIEQHFKELFKYEDDNWRMVDVVKFMCSKISTIKVYEGNDILVDLGEPNYFLLESSK